MRGIKDIGQLGLTTESVPDRQDNKGEVVLYQPDDSLSLDVRLENGSVWLNRQQMSVLFGRDVKTIGKHINNALKEELAGLSSVANFATVQMEGSRDVERKKSIMISMAILRNCRRLSYRGFLGNCFRWQELCC